jgi:GT2 family glycosyltransferase
MATPEPRVFIVVLNWNGLADTMQCLDSLGRLNYRGEVRIVVVDNGSTDGSPTALRVRYPGITLIENSRNLGYTGGNNAGLRFAWAEGADYTWLLNNDTTVDADCLSRLIRAGEAMGEVGLLSPGVCDPTTGELHWAGTVLDVAQREFADVVAAEKRGVSIPEGPLLLWGTGLLIKRSAGERVGDLDDRYFAYIEDFDYSLRTIKVGMLTRVIRDARIFHKASRSLGEMSPLRHYLMTRNRFVFWSAHLGKEWTWHEMGRRIAEILGEAEEWERGGRQEISGACLDALWDAVRGHFGDMTRKGKMPWLVQRVLMWRPYLWIRLLQARWAEIMKKIGAAAKRSK